MEGTAPMMQSQPCAKIGHISAKGEDTSTDKGTDSSVCHWIGLLGKILTGNQSYFPIKYGAFRLKLSLHPSQWVWPCCALLCLHWLFHHPKNRKQTRNASRAPSCWGHCTWLFRHGLKLLPVFDQFSIYIYKYIIIYIIYIYIIICIYNYIYIHLSNYARIIWWNMSLSGAAQVTQGCQIIHRFKDVNCIFETSWSFKMVMPGKDGQHEATNHFLL